MKRFAILASLMLMAVGLPTAMASHLSVGYMTTAGMEAEESPDDPSVPGTTPGDKSTPYGVGTSEDCYDADAEVSPQEANESAFADTFCGDLLYNEQIEDLKRDSPPDQDIPEGSPIDVFDVQIGYSQPAGIVWGACEPWCLAAGGVAAGPTAWEAFHTAGAAAGVTDGPDQAREEHGPGDTQILTQDLTIPNAFGVVQEETGLWKMDGWNGPPPVMERAIAFIYDEEGDFVDSDDLNQMIDEAIGNNDLSSQTKYEVCGMNPGTEYDSSQAQTFCEIKFYDQKPGDDGTGDTKFDGYSNKCNSPSYVCAADGPYWRSQNVGLAGSFGGQTTQTDVHHMHYVIAPNPAECPNVMPNHLDFDGDGASMPYLAHDLDVYTPVTETSAGPTVSSDGLTDYANALAGDRPALPALPSQAQGAVDSAEQAVADATDPIGEDDMIEPNNGDPVAGIPDNSRTAIVEKRDDPEPCQEIVDNEDEETRDPWVNLLDAQVQAQQDLATGSLGASAAGLGASVDLPDGYGNYGSSDGSQDASNRPGPSLFSTHGKVGVFADKNDDGDYDQQSAGQGVWQADDIQQIGAYPMMWDMHVEDGTQDDPQNSGGGCATGPGGSFASTMADTGYGPNTALVQAIYLKEPTVFTDGDTQNPEVLPYPGGNNIYLLANDAARTLWDGDTTATAGNAVDAKVDDLVEDLRSYVTSEHGAGDGIEVHQPGDDLGLGSDFLAQCDEPSGGFTSALSFTHDCQLDCSGDTVATMYTFEVVGTESYGDTLGGESVPPLKIGGDVYDFQDGQNTWYDVDPLDNDPTRNEQQQDPPSTG